MLKAQNIFKSFGKNDDFVLRGINLEIQSGEFVSLTGKSGSGKSTLLYILSTLDTPTKGQVIYDQKNLENFKRSELYNFRNKNIGFVFQFHYLIQELTALENVLLPARKANEYQLRKNQALEMIKNIGLEGKEHRYSWELSGGEQQRVAIARALIMDPAYLFADEPTGNLDSANGQMVMELLREINQKNKTTILYVTHDKDFALLADRSINLIDGVTSP